MFQRFYENTQISRTVKNLLATEPIPILQTVTSKSYLLEGCRYVYDNRIIKCTETGILSDNYEVDVDATVDTTKHVSKVSWYDDETHKYLGNYLRYLRDSRSIDLMRYYNCYNSMELADIYLNTSSLSPLRCSNDKVPNDEGQLVYKVSPSDSLRCGSLYTDKDAKTYGFGSVSGYKVIAVPINFDTTYTVAIDSYKSIFVRGIIYNNNGMVEVDPELGLQMTYYSDYLDYSCVTRSHSNFNSPFEYRIDLASPSDKVTLTDEEKVALYARQKDLYLVLQVPTSSASSIVVLEGSYLNKHKKIVQGSSSSSEQESFTIAVPEYINNKKQFMIYPDNLSLLHYNTGTSYAFSDRLIEYLLLNVVTPLETLPTNISRVQESLGLLYPSYSERLARKFSLNGVWDDSIKTYVRALVYENLDHVAYPMDHDGYVNKDVEALLSSKGVYIT